MQELKLITDDIYGYIQIWKDEYSEQYVLLVEPFLCDYGEYKVTSIVKLVDDATFIRLGSNNPNRFYQYDKVYLITKEEQDIFLLAK